MEPRKAMMNGEGMTLKAHAPSNSDSLSSSSLHAEEYKRANFYGMVTQTDRFLHWLVPRV
jgi:hypothetical protein